MDKTIYLRDVLKEMQNLDADKNPVPFNLVVREFSSQKKTGGTLTKYIGATLMQQGKKRSLISLAEGREQKNPNHWENKTRNIKAGEKIRKINILFIIEFNGLKVVY